MPFRYPVVICALLSASCSTQVAEKKVVVLPEPVTGLHALDQMFVMARGWAPDVQIFRLTSMNVPEIKAKPGRAGAWQVIFISPSLSQSKTFTFAADDISSSLPKGVNFGRAEAWSEHGTSRPFRIEAAKTDSDSAYATAIKKGGDYPAKNLGMNITYQLELTGSYGNAAWRVLWGDSASTSSFSVIVDATSGNYVETLH